MNILSDNDLELIEAKIDDTLTKENVDQFDQKINASIAFKEEFEFQNAIVRSIGKSNQNRVRQELVEFMAESKQAKSRLFNNRYLMIAASISVIALLSMAYFFMPQNKISANELYQAYFEVYPAPPITRGNDVNVETNIFENYRKGDYSQSIELFKSNSSTEFASLYLASCYLQLDENQKAINVLEKGLSSENLMVAQSSEWYLALAQLKIGKLEESEKILQKIVSKKQLFKSEAEKILIQLAE